MDDVDDGMYIFIAGVWSFLEDEGSESSGVFACRWSLWAGYLVEEETDIKKRSTKVMDFRIALHYVFTRH